MHLEHKDEKKKPLHPIANLHIAFSWPVRLWSTTVVFATISTIVLPPNATINISTIVFAAIKPRATFILGLIRLGSKNDPPAAFCSEMSCRGNSKAAKP